MIQPIDTKPCDRSEGHPAGLVIGQLSLGEQLVIWAFRKRLADGSEVALVQGFHIAFGLSMVEAALAAFNGLYNTVFHHCSRDLGFHATRCSCVSSDEMMLVSLIAANHAGMTSQAREIGRCLVHETSVQDLLDDASMLSLLMHRQSLQLPLRSLVTCLDKRASFVH